MREEGRWRVAERRHGVDAPALHPAPSHRTTSDPATRYLIDRAEIEDCITTFASGIDHDTGGRVEPVTAGVRECSFFRSIVCVEQTFSADLQD